MKSNPARRDDTKYCEFHKDHGHQTDDCIQLKKEIEYLIQRGHLDRYVASEGQERVQPLGSIQLVLTLGDPPCQDTTMVRFLIVDTPLAYNMLSGRPSLNAIRFVPSAYHMVIKFPTANGVGMVRGNRLIAKECYLASMKQNTVDNIDMDELDMQEEVTTRPAPSEELKPTQLSDQPEHLVYIGSKLAEDIISSLVRFLEQNMEVFA